MQARWPQIEYLVAEPVEATEIKYIFIPLQHEKQTIYGMLLLGCG